MEERVLLWSPSEEETEAEELASADRLAGKAELSTLQRPAIDPPEDENTAWRPTRSQLKEGILWAVVLGPPRCMVPHRGGRRSS
mgnify:CR=1 FL=1